MALNVTIDGEQFEFFQSASLTFRYNSVGSSFKLKGFFDQGNQEIRRLFRPLQFRRIVIKDDDRTVLTGTVINTSFTATKTEELATLTGYSLPGVLEDCQIPVSSYPLQFDNLSIKQIAEQLIQPFGIRLVVDDLASEGANEVITRVTANDGQSIQDFISKTCSQKNLILSHDVRGRLVITRARTSGQIQTFFDAQTPVTKLDSVFNGRGLHSDITVFKQTSIQGGNAAEESIENPFVSSFRPTTRTQTTGTENDTQQAARNVLAEELRNINVTITTDRWYWLNGERLEIMQPNRVVGVRSERAYLFGVQRWFVEEVTLNSDPSKQTGIVKLVLPEVYNNEPVKSRF
jgi:prophage tail gpP-like protein